MASESTPPAGSGVPDDEIDTARLQQIRSDVHAGAELIGALAQDARLFAAMSGPGTSDLTELAIAAGALADQAKASGDLVLALLEPAGDGCAEQAGGETFAERVRLACEWADLLRRQLVAAVKVQAVICTRLSDRVAVVREWEQGDEERDGPTGDPRALVEHARLLMRCVEG